jgi:AhpC/TSA family
MDMLPKHTRSLPLFGVLLGAMLAVASMAVAVEIGEPALDFTLPSTTGETISLSQFRGKQHVLLEFYVNDFGPT